MQVATQPSKVLATSAPPARAGSQLDLYVPSLPLRYSIRGCQTIQKYQQMQPHHICGAGKIIPLRKQLSRKPSNSKVKQLDQGHLEMGNASQCTPQKPHTLIYTCNHPFAEIAIFFVKCQLLLNPSLDFLALKLHMLPSTGAWGFVLVVSAGKTILLIWKHLHKANVDC